MLLVASERICEGYLKSETNVDVSVLLGGLFSVCE